MLLQIWNTQSCRSGVAPDLAYLNFRLDSLWLSSPPVSQVSGLRRISQTPSFFLSSQSAHFWNMIIQFYVWFLANQRGSVLGYSSIIYICIYWPVPSLVAAEAVLLHIWNLPTEMTRKQSCCSERCCSRSGIQSCCSDASVHIWHILNFRQDYSWFSSPPVSGLRSHFWDFTSKFFLSSHQSDHFWNLITQSYVWFLAHQRGSVLGNSSLCISYPSQARFWTDRYDLLQFSSTS